MTHDLGTSSGGAEGRRGSPEAWVMLRPAVAVSLVSGVLFGIASRFIRDSELLGALFGVMTLSFLCLVPMVIGYLTVRPHPHPS
jgi:phage shock protein PspC (stress-responsive transcriptional regulator)